MTEPLSPPARRASWPVAAGLVLAAVALAGLVLSVRRPGPTVAGRDLGPAPEFRLASLDGRQLGPADYAGKVLLVDFWATWCGPCHVQSDILKELYAEVRGQGVEFLAVSVGEEEETVRSFLRRSPYPYPVLVDPADELSDRLEIVALPTIMVIDRSGRVVFSEPGVSDRDTLAGVLRAAGAG